MSFYQRRNMQTRDQARVKAQDTNSQKQIKYTCVDTPLYKRSLSVLYTHKLPRDKYAKLLTCTVTQTQTKVIKWPTLPPVSFYFLSSLSLSFTHTQVN